MTTIAEPKVRATRLSGFPETRSFIILETSPSRFFALLPQIDIMEQIIRICIHIISLIPTDTKHMRPYPYTLQKVDISGQTPAILTNCSLVRPLMSIGWYRKFSRMTLYEMCMRFRVPMTSQQHCPSSEFSFFSNNCVEVQIISALMKILYYKRRMPAK